MAGLRAERTLKREYRSEEAIGLDIKIEVDDSSQLNKIPSFH